MVDNEKVIEWSYYTSWSREQLVERIKELEKLTQNLKETEISLIEKNKFLKEISMEDCLTKVYNYRTIIEIIERQIKYSN